MSCQILSDVTKRYLHTYYKILDCMIHGMSDVELTDSLSYNYIVQMVPHHRAAIEMSENLLKYTTCIPLQRIAQNIINEQTAGIQDMEEILKCCGTKVNTEQEVCQYYKNYDRITDTMFTFMGNARSGNDINCNFMREMIPHHEGAIQMSKNALQFPICPELVPILRNIINTQEDGIRKMQELKRQYCGRC